MLPSGRGEFIVEMYIDPEDGKEGILAVECLVEYAYDPGVLWDGNGTGRPASWTDERTVLGVERVLPSGERVPVRDWERDREWLEAAVDSQDAYEIQRALEEELRAAEYD